jgi:hypothetical protein
MSVFPVVKGTRARFTKTNSCGLPIAGPAGYLVTDGFVSVELTPVNREAQDLEQLNAEGRVCVADRTPPERKWYTAAIELCNVNTGLISMLTSWPQELDFDDNPVGFRDKKRVEADFGVAIEVWTGGKADDDCPSPTEDSIFSAAATGKKYGYLLTCATEFTLGNIRVAGEISTFTLTGLTYAMPQWGRGPWNVAAIDGSGTAGRLLTPMDDDSHFALFRTPVPPPDITPGAEACPLAIATIFVNPDYYFGGPSSAPAADVAPAQAVCNAEQYTVTITGTPTGGTFTITVDGQTTAGIAFDATAAAFKTAVLALSNIDPGQADVTGGPGPGTPYTLSLDPQFGTPTADGAGLTGGTSPNVTITPV